MNKLNKCLGCALILSSVIVTPTYAATAEVVQEPRNMGNSVVESIDYNIYRRLGDISAKNSVKLVQEDNGINCNGLFIPVTKGTPRYNFLVNALDKLGCPYAWGGEGQIWLGSLIAGDGSTVDWADPNYTLQECKGKNSYDCSGLVKVALKTVGVDVPHFSGSQCSNSYGATIIQPSSLADLKPGMLLGNNEHVVIYLGNGYILEAPETGKTVRIISMQDRFGSNVIPQNYVCVDYFNN